MGLIHRLRKKYETFPGLSREQMPKLLANNRYPMSSAEIFELRVKESTRFLWNSYVKVGDLAAYDGSRSDEQEIKFILTTTRAGVTDIGKFALGLINKKSKYTGGGLDLTRAYDSLANKEAANAYEALQGNGVIAVKRKDIGILNQLLTQEQVLNHKGWRILARHRDEVPKEFAEDFEVFKEYTRIVFSDLRRTSYSRCHLAMGFSFLIRCSNYDRIPGLPLPYNASVVPRLKTFCIAEKLHGWFNVTGWFDLDNDDDNGYDYCCPGNDFFVGVAPEALAPSKVKPTRSFWNRKKDPWFRA